MILVFFIFVQKCIERKRIEKAEGYKIFPHKEKLQKGYLWGLSYGFSVKTFGYPVRIFEKLDFESNRHQMPWPRGLLTCIFVATWIYSLLSIKTTRFMILKSLEKFQSFGYGFISIKISLFWAKTLKLHFFFKTIDWRKKFKI